MTATIQQIRVFARDAHAGQFRRDGVTPYFNHVEDVARRCAGHMEEEMTALLHDVLEDTSVTADDLRSFAVEPRVFEAVEAMTHRPDEEYSEYLRRVGANPIARYVKIRDMISNLADGPTDKQLRKYALGLEYLTRDPVRE